MNILPARFKVKFVLIVSTLLTIVVIIAIAFYISTERFNYVLNRSNLANDVYANYLSVSSRTHRKLNTASQAVYSGKAGDEQTHIQNKQQLKAAVASVRKNIAAELIHVRDEDEREELDLLSEIERLTEIIIDGSLYIREELEAGNLSSASSELAKLKSEPITGKFNKLIDQALKEESREALEAQATASALTRKIKLILPISISLILIPGLFITTLTASHLSLSIAELQRAAKAYREGKLDHKIDQLSDKEFSDLGYAFNEMGHELNMRRKTTLKTHESLELIVQDRTRELEELNKKLQTVDDSRRQLLTDISHELRTPLTVIQGESEMALRGNAKTTREYQDALIRVREQTIHTARLVDDLLFVARAEEGKARVEKHLVAIANIFQSVCRDFYVIAKKKRIEIVESYAHEHVVVFGDTGRLRQVLSALLDNAIRYSHWDSQVSVGLTVLSGQNLIELKITDHGIGLTQKEAHRAFNRFYRGDNAKRHARGTGIGLPVAKAIIEAHGGQISLSGSPGKGAEAIVVLPIENNMKAIA